MTANINMSSHAKNAADHDPETEKSLGERVEWLVSVAIKTMMESIPDLTDQQWQAILNAAIQQGMFPTVGPADAALDRAIDIVRNAHPSLNNLPMAQTTAVIEVLRTWWCEHKAQYGAGLNDFQSFKAVMLSR